MDQALEQEVRRRAHGIYEYCHLPEKLSELRHVIDHIIARQHSGPTVPENLALSCGRCNRHKGPNIAGIDPLTLSATRLFNPRIDTWRDHFRWNAFQLVGTTSIGRTTTGVLAINHPYRLATRQVLVAAGRLRLA